MQQNFSSDLFISHDYKPYTFSHNSVTQTIQHCNSASTDYDLTGQIVWPASDSLAIYVVDNREMFEGKVVLEVGAGAGLSGIVCSRYAKKVLLTDGSDTVVELLVLNAQNRQQVQSLKFDWRDYAEFYQKYGQQVEVIIGADVMFWPSSMRPLCETIRYFMEKQKNKGIELKVIVALKNRSKATENQFDQILKEYQLERKTVKLINEIPIFFIVSTK